jgi:ECF sigma factor
MDPAGAITRWISQVRSGDRASADPLWEVYFHRVVVLARDRLRLQRIRELWAREGNS